MPFSRLPAPPRARTFVFGNAAFSAGSAVLGPVAARERLSGALWAAGGVIAAATLPIFVVCDVWTVRAPA